MNGIKISFKVDENGKPAFEVSSEPVGQITGSPNKDFYVYEWFIKETGEVFYVGKGRGNRYKTHHDRAYEAERIRQLYDTDVRFVGTELTEEQAVELESAEMTRILDETTDRLTNRITPLFAKRDNGYGRSPSTPSLQFEIAPQLYASEIDEHYYGIKARPFDSVDLGNLKAVAFIHKGIQQDILETVYGGQYDKYYEETIKLLENNDCRIIQSRYAKSVTAWIYPGDDYVVSYDLDKSHAQDRLGHVIPAYHLLDVRKALLDKYGNPSLDDAADFIDAIHTRIPLSEIKNKDDWEKGFDEGSPYYFQGEEKRKAGEIIEAIRLFDMARSLGYDAPALYTSYAMAYRKIKDYANEVAIMDEAILRNQRFPSRVTEFSNRRRAAIKKMEAAK